MGREQKSHVIDPAAVVRAAQDLVAAFDFLEPDWRETTLNHPEDEGDCSNAAWDALIEALEGPATRPEVAP
jgi:hypothetical protein